MTDAEIERTAPPELKQLPTDFWDTARLVPAVSKAAISLRVDVDVLTWFREQGPRYQSRMNAVLRAYMQATAQPAKDTTTTPAKKSARKSSAKPAAKRTASSRRTR